MKKGIIIGIVVVLLLLVGFFLLKGGNKATAPAGEGMKGGVSEQPKKSDNGLLDTAEKIKNAMLGGQKMECNFKDQGDGSVPVETVMQSQGEKFRTVSKVEGETQISISDGKIMYSWSEKDKKGMKYDLECLEELSKDTPETNDNPSMFETPDYETPTEIIESVPEMDCRPIASIDLTVPKDVTFEDGCAMLRQLQEMTKQFQIPQGVNIPGQ